jgi:cytochrome b6-f complex iron-sulfur subunit
VSTTIPASRTRGALLLRLIVAVLALSATAAVLFLAAVRVPPRTPGPGWVRGAAMSVVRSKGVVMVPSARAFLIDTGRSSPLAVSARSPQMGETVIHCETSGWFEDPMHGSKFDQLGHYALGPAPRGLDRYAVRLLDGVAWIDPAAVTPGPPRGTPTADPTGPFCVHG